MSDIRRFLSYFRPQRRRIVAVVLLTMVGSLCEAVLLVALVPLAQAVMKVNLGSSTFGPLSLASLSTPQLLVVAVVMITLSSAMSITSSVVSIGAQAQWQHTWKHRVMQAFLQADWPTQSKERGGKLIALTNTNVNQGAVGLANFTSGAGAAIGLVTMIGTAVIISPLGALLMIVCGAGLFFALRPLSNASKRNNGRLGRFNMKVSATITEQAQLARETRLFGVEDEIDHLVDEQLFEHERLRKRAALILAMTTPAYRMGGVLVVLGLIFVASQLDQTSAASLGTAALLLYRSVGYGQALQRAHHAVHETIPYLEGTDEELEVFLSHPYPAGPRTMEPPTVVELDHVTFAYGDEGPALTDVSLTFRRGEIVGVAGPSGAGKTTLAQLLLRLRAPTQGEVRVDGVPIEEFTKESWARHVALVPQDGGLFHGTVVENISYLRPHVTRAAVEAAALAAGLHDTILGLPDGYETEIGPATRNLSGGQIQRVSIARALAGDPSILVLDEPTSALDSGTEAIIQQTLAELHGKLMVVIIAHRLSTLTICDRVLVMAGGAVTKEGPPDQILAVADLDELDVVGQVS